MNKFFTSALALVVGIMSATAQDATTEFKWGKMFDGGTSAGDQAQGVAFDGKGNTYWHLIGGTKTDLPDVNYGGSLLFQGAPYEGTSQNGNLCILKTDENGEVLWKLYSDYGDFSSNSGTVLVTKSSGDAVFSAKVRSTEGFESEGIRLIDGKGNEFTYKYDTAAERRYQNVMLGCVASDGTLKWVKFVDAEYKLMSDGSFCADAIECQGLAVDSNDNIYLGGIYCTPLHIEGSDKVLTPRLSATWDGNAQKKIGDVYLLKFNLDGDFIENATLTGNVLSEKIVGMDMVEDNLYLCFYLEGSGEQVSFGGKTFSTDGDATMAIIKSNTDFDSAWIEAVKCTKASNQLAVQNASLNAFGGNVWFAAQVTGNFTDMADATKTIGNSAAMREGMLLKLNDETGAWETGAMSKKDYTVNALTGYFRVYPNPEDESKVYVFGYGMNANVGIFLRIYDAETLSSDADSAITLVSAGATGSCQCSAYDTRDGRFYMTARSNQAMTALGGTAFAKPEGWGVLTAAFSMPKENIETGAVKVMEENEFKVIGGKGTLTIINNGEAMSVEIYDLSGRRVSRVEAEGTVDLSLEPGIYIVAGKKCLVK